MIIIYLYIYSEKVYKEFKILELHKLKLLIMIFQNLNLHCFSGWSLVETNKTALGWSNFMYNMIIFSFSHTLGNVKNT